MSTVRYTNIEGQIVAEKRSGVRRGYIPDATWSTTALVASNAAISDSICYWPFGETAQRTGSTPTRFQFVGGLGIATDIVGRASSRKTCLRFGTARWLQPTSGRGVAPMSAYSYAMTDLAEILSASVNPLLVQAPKKTKVPSPPSIRFNPDPWNKKPAIENNNCTCYAYNRFSDVPIDPGWLAKQYRLDAASCADVIRAAMKDGLTTPDPKTGKCPSGKHLVRFFVDPNGVYGYHAIRQDADGRWSGKPGKKKAERCDPKTPSNLWPERCKQDLCSPNTWPGNAVP